MGVGDDVRLFCQSIVFLGVAYVALRQTVPNFLKCKTEKELRQQRAWRVAAPASRAGRERKRRNRAAAGT